MGVPDIAALVSSGGHSYNPQDNYSRNYGIEKHYILCRPYDRHVTPSGASFGLLLPVENRDPIPRNAGF
jgi:hypothetical protein